MNLGNCREKIDSIDTQILALLNRRSELSKYIGELKANAGLEIIDVDREDVILRRIARDNPGDMEASAAVRIYRQILDESRRIQIEHVGARSTGIEASK
jgi:chorismate mutase/prephenate dehydratase